VGVEFKSTPAKTEKNCISRDELEKVIDDRKLQSLLQSYTTNGKVHEIMFTPLNNGEIIVVEYDKVGPTTKKYCILSITNETNINETSIDNLYDALEKVRGHRA
jgi:hypothetical protein